MTSIEQKSNDAKIYRGTILCAGKTPPPKLAEEYDLVSGKFNVVFLQQ
jgi:hypothetical protein